MPSRSSDASATSRMCSGRLLVPLATPCRYAGLFPPDASDIGTQCERILGDAVGKYRSAFQKKLETAILASSAKKTKAAGKRASTIANMLCACGLTWKHSLSSQQEFLEKMRDAIQLCCRDLAGD